MKKMDEVEILKRYSRCDMKRESLALCRRFLRRKNLSSHAFVTITDALLMHANNLQRWKGSIEAALEKIPLNARPYVTKQLFYFYVSISEWRSASVYLPKAPVTHADLLFSMWTHLEMRDVRQAKKIFYKCQRKLRAEADNLDDFALCTIYEALASYSAQTGDWDRAARYWKQSYSHHRIFADNAWEGLIKIEAYAALLHANEAFALIKDDAFWKAGEYVDGIRPGNRNTMRASLDKKYHRLAKHLAKVIPPKDRWRFGR